MQLADVLQTKGSSVVTLHPHDSVLAAARTFVDGGVGCAVVMADQVMVGIVSERDIVRLVAREEDVLATTAVEAIMTRKVTTLAPDAPVQRAMEVMTEKRIRHLPIVRDHRLVGLVSIGDVVRALRDGPDEESAPRSLAASGG